MGHKGTATATAEPFRSTACWQPPPHMWPSTVQNPGVQKECLGVHKACMGESTVPSAPAILAATAVTAVTYLLPVTAAAKFLGTATTTSGKATRHASTQYQSVHPYNLNASHSRLTGHQLPLWS